MNSRVLALMLSSQPSSMAPVDAHATLVSWLATVSTPVCQKPRFAVTVELYSLSAMTNMLYLMGTTCGVKNTLRGQSNAFAGRISVSTDARSSATIRPLSYSIVCIGIWNSANRETIASQTRRFSTMNVLEFSNSYTAGGVAAQPDSRTYVTDASNTILILIRGVCHRKSVTRTPRPRDWSASAQGKFLLLRIEIASRPRRMGRRTSALQRSCGRSSAAIECRGIAAGCCFRAHFSCVRSRS